MRVALRGHLIDPHYHGLFLLLISLHGDLQSAGLNVPGAEQDFVVLEMCTSVECSLQLQARMNESLETEMRDTNRTIVDHQRKTDALKRILSRVERIVMIGLMEIRTRVQNRGFITSNYSTKQSILY